MKAHRVFALSGLALLVVTFQAVFINEPWGHSHASWNGAWYLGRMSRSWDIGGFVNMRGETCLSVLPTRPVVTRGYWNHPPFYPWVHYFSTRFFQRSEPAFRVLPILMHFLSALGLYFLLRRRGFESIFAAIGAVQFSVLPMSLEFGRMPNPESSVLAMILWAWLAHERTVDLGLRPYCCTGLLFAFACGFDWQGWFLVPSLIVFELARSTRAQYRKRLTRVLLLVMAGGAVALAHASLIGAWDQSGLWGGISRILEKGTKTVEEYSAHSRSEWWCNQGTALLSMFGYSGIAAAAIGMAGVYSIRARHPRILALCSGLVSLGVLNIVLFRHHAFDHKFFWFYLGPLVAVLSVAAIKWISGRSLMAASAIVLLICGGTATEAILRHDPGEPIESREIIHRVNALLGPSDLLLRADEFGPEVFYIESIIWDDIVDPVEISRIYTGWKNGWISVRRIVYLLPDWIAAKKPHIARRCEEFGDVIQLRGLRVVQFH